MQLLRTAAVRYRNHRLVVVRKCRLLRGLEFVTSSSKKIKMVQMLARMKIFRRRAKCILTN